jgi:hypothetical protein
MSIIYCETSFISTDPKKVYQHFKDVEDNQGQNYIAQNDDYWISVIEMDTPNAKEVSFDSSQEFNNFMGKFEISKEEVDRRFNNKNT